MNVSLRKFPFPYRCALAISSDIDNASSLNNFVEFMEFLNTKRQTKYGLGLEYKKMEVERESPVQLMEHLPKHLMG